MVRDVLSQNTQTDSSIKFNKLGVNIQHAQERIYQYLLNIVKQKSSTEVLQEFKNLFIDYDTAAGNPAAIEAITELIFANNEQEFRDTIKRCCYILINNWYMARSHTSIQELVELFANVKLYRQTLSPTLSRQRTWLYNFTNGSEYKELKLFLSRYSEKAHWSNRYQSYLLVPQYTNLDNPVEQREAARAFSLKLKEKFKLDLAMYTARSQSAINQNRIINNPTAFGDNVIDFIKKIVARNGLFHYENLANLFVEQTRKVNYRYFKSCLLNYLNFSLLNNNLGKKLEQKLAENLNDLYADYHEESLDEALLLRTCNRVIDRLTTEDRHKPSDLFIWLMSQGHHILLAILLLKIILISPNARNHLETNVATLIEYYVNYPEEDCKWVITFFEVFKIAFAIYADDVQYNLIKMNGNTPDKFSDLDLNAYRVFSQLRQYNSAKSELENNLPNTSQETLVT